MDGFLLQLMLAKGIDYAKPEVSAEANPYFIENGGRPIRSRCGLPNIDMVLIHLLDSAGIC